MANIYVASSWRNQFQPLVVRTLADLGHHVYDFRHPAPGNDGFQWRAVGDDRWELWSVEQYLAALRHPVAERGFSLDMDALRRCDVCVYVMPCGVSASLEAGWAKGAGKPLAVYAPRHVSRYHTHTVVLACLKVYPGATMRQIADETGLTMMTVNGSLYILLKHGRVQRSHRQADQRGRPVCWTLTNG